MEASEAGSFTRVAQLYEAFHVPGLFREWAELVAEAAELGPGQRVLDVACGTGVLTRTVAGWVGPGGRVVGVDPSEGMLEVARRSAPGIEWRPGHAEALPLEDGRFDAVVSQFGLTFFADRAGAVREMLRVLRPGGRLAVAVWDSLENFRLYAALDGLLRRRCGDAVADAALVPHSLGSAERLAAVFAEAGVAGVRIARRETVVRYPSLRDWLRIEVKEWLLGGGMDEPEIEALLGEAREVFRPFLGADGAVVAPAPGYLATAVRPS